MSSLLSSQNGKRAVLTRGSFRGFQVTIVTSVMDQLFSLAVLGNPLGQQRGRLQVAQLAHVARGAFAQLAHVARRALSSLSSFDSLA